MYHHAFVNPLLILLIISCSGPPPATPTPIPAPTPVPYEDFAGAEIPPADPEQLAQLTKVLSLVPEGFSSAVYLDTDFLRSNESLGAIINPEVLGLDVALPSIATGLVSRLAVAADFQPRSVVTPFQSDFAIADMLRLAGGFGLQHNTQKRQIAHVVPFAYDHP